MLAGRPEGAGPGTGAVTFSTHWSRMVSTAFRLISTNRVVLRPEGGVVTAEGLKAFSRHDVHPPEQMAPMVEIARRCARSSLPSRDTSRISVTFPASLSY